MATTITNSPYISSLDSKITADLCEGVFTIDVTNSVFLPSGDIYVQGASVKITNPVGVVIRDYTTSGFDIEPPMTGSVSISIPLVALNYLYGSYIITVKLTDADGDEYLVTKTVNICPPNAKNKTKKEGCLEAKIKGNCKDGKVVIVLDQVSTYKGILSVSQVNDLTVEYPTSSELPPLETAVGSFSVVLFEGIYKVTGTVCVTYAGDDNVYYKVQYKVKCEKNIKCRLDECCVQAQLEALKLKADSDCSQKEKDETASTIVNALFLLELIYGAADCGEDPSDFISDLEELLGCTCTCNCENIATPIIDNTPATDYVFTGCGIQQNTTGLTKTVTINNYAYKIVGATGSGIVVSAGVVDQDLCKVTQTIGFDSTGSGIRPYKVISGLLNQSDSSAPVFTTRENTSGAAVILARSGTGNYVLSLSVAGLFQNYLVFISGGNKDRFIYYDTVTSTVNDLNIKTTNASASADGILTDTTIEIRFY